MGSVLLLATATAVAGPLYTDEIPGDGDDNQADWAYKLDVIEVRRTSILKNVAPYLAFELGHSGADLLHYVVYAEDTPEDWDLVWDSGLVGPIGTTADFWPSPTVDLRLEGGRRYAVGVVFDDGNYRYWYDAPAGVTPFAWGRHMGSIYTATDTTFAVPARIAGEAPLDVGYWAEITVEVIDQDGDGVTEDLDCDDTDPANYPGGPELCDGRDNDCTGAADDPVDTLDWYPDQDRDGFGDTGRLVSNCTGVAPRGHIPVGGDCDDGNPAIHPGVEEYCDGVDEDCSGVADDDPVTRAGFADDDGDTFGGAPTSWCTRELPAGLVLNALDCDDTDAGVFPGAVETCDGADQDCDGAADDGLPTRTWWRDADLDGAGNLADTLTWCATAPPGWVTDATDCDDGDPRRTPGNEEVCDGVDDDCDGVAGGEGDFDADGWIDCQDCAAADASTYPGAPEACDGVDHDCDGLVPTRLECDPAPFESIAVAAACGGCASTSGTGAGPLPFLAFGAAAAATRRRRW